MEVTKRKINERRIRNLAFRLLMSLMLFVMVVAGVLNGNALTAQATVQPDLNYYVTDKSNVLTNETKTHILKINQLFEITKEQPQIAVVIVPTLKGVDIEAYAIEQFEVMEIGNADYDNGVLILLATDDREIRIEVGYGLEGALPDSKVGRIIDASIDDLAAGNYSQAIYDIFNQLVLSVQEEYAYGDLLNGAVPVISDATSHNEFRVVILMIIGIVIYLAVCKAIGINTMDALILLMNVLSSAADNRSSSSEHRSDGGGGRSGGGGASRGF